MPEDVYVRDHVWGSPRTCIEKLERINALIGADEFVAVFSYGGLPLDKAERSLRLFAAEVLPTVQRLTPARFRPWFPEAALGPATRAKRQR